MSNLTEINLNKGEIEMYHKRYGFGMYQESSKKDIDIDENIDDVEETDSDMDIEDEDDKPKKKSSKKSKKKDNDMDIDIDDEDKEDEENDKPKKKKKSKNKNKDIDDGDEDIDFEDECGDGCSSKFKCESAKDKKDNNDDADIDLDSFGSDEEPEENDEDEDEKSSKSKKKEKPKKDVDFDDEDDDEDKCDEDDDECESKSKKKKSSKKSKKDDDEDEDDMDVDIDIEEECGDGGCKSFKEYVAEKKRMNRNLDVSDFFLEGATTSSFDTNNMMNDDQFGDVDDGGSNEGPDIDAETECGDPVKFGTESAKSKKDKDDDLDVDVDEDEDNCDEDECDDKCDEDDDECESKSKKKKSSKKSKKDENEDKDDESPEDEDDVDFKDEAMHPTKASPDFVKPAIKEHDDLQSEYAVDLLRQEELRTERQIMTSLIDAIYKEYEIMETCPDYFEEFYEEDSDDEYDEEIVQERYFGGLGHKAANIAKPIVKAGKHMNERKNGVGKKGLIRNTLHRTKKDLKKGGFVYKLLTWPFLLIKNLAQTIYHKIKAFTAYKSTMRAIEVNINKQITLVKKNIASVPGMATAAGVGYVATSVASIAKGEGLQINPLEFIMSEGSKIIESLGQDSMLRGLTYSLANAFENAPEKIGVVLKASRNASNAQSNQKVTPDMANDSRNILTVTDGHTRMQGVVNMKAIDQFMDDIDEWGDIAEKMIDDISDKNVSNIEAKIKKLEEIEDRYVSHGKLKTDAIFSEKGETIKVADFYQEFSSKLEAKVKQLENGLKSVSEIESSMSSEANEISEDMKKIITQANTLIQHTCNSFMEIIDTIDDLGKYTVNTMHKYLNCLEQTNEKNESKSSSVIGRKTKETS